MRLLLISALHAPPLRPAWVRGPEPGWAPQAPLSTESAKRRPGLAWLPLRENGASPPGLPAHHAGWGADGGPVALLGRGTRGALCLRGPHGNCLGLGFTGGSLPPPLPSPNMGGAGAVSVEVGAEGKGGSSGVAGAQVHWGWSRAGGALLRGTAPRSTGPLPCTAPPPVYPFLLTGENSRREQGSWSQWEPPGKRERLHLPQLPTPTQTPHPIPDLPPRP